MTTNTSEVLKKVDSNIQSLFFENSESNDLNALWMQICLGDLKALQKLHKNLYPKLFNYVYLILKEEAAAELIIADLFVNLWRQSDKSFFCDIQVIILKRVRMLVFKHLLKFSDADNTPANHCPTVFKTNSFHDTEVAFLVSYFKLNEINIAEITDQ